MDNLTTCEIIRQSSRASDMKKNFICAQDALHESMLNSPWPIFLYAASVLFIMFLVQRAADAPHRMAAIRKAEEDNAEDQSEDDKR